MTYGFEQGIENGWNILSKAGDVIGAHADLVLVPDAGVGIYVAYNGEGIGGGAMLAAKQLTQRFINDFLPHGDVSANVPEVESIPTTAEKFAGNYSSIQFSRTTFTKMSTLFQSVTVTAEPDGTLTTEGLSADPALVPRHWIQIGDNLFRERDGQQTIAFGLDNNGNVVSLYASEDPSIAFERQTWYELPMLYMALCGIPLLLLIFNAVLWPVAALARRFRRQPSGQNRAALIARWLVWGTGILLILFLIGFYLMIKDFNVFLETVTVGTSPLLKFTLLMPTLAAATTAAAIVYNVSAWLKHWWNKRTRVYYTAVTVCAVVFMLVAANYRLVGWPLF
jgi:TM2 domain-containing membrane protein YozV